jgi:hypothetical protein
VENLQDAAMYAQSMPLLKRVTVNEPSIMTDVLIAVYVLKRVDQVLCQAHRNV